MKNSCRALLLGCLTLFASQASADWHHGRDSEPYKWHLGVDYKFTLAKGKNDWGKIFRKTHPGVNFTFGWLHNQHWGIEGGYSATTRRTREFNLAAGQTAFGALNAGPGNIQVSSRLRLKGFHVDGMFYYPIWRCLEGVGSLGLGFNRQSVRISTNSPGSALDTALASTAGRTKAIFRAGAGLQALVHENFGLRGMLRYDSTGMVRFRKPASNTAGEKALRDSFSFLIGMYWRLT